MKLRLAAIAMISMGCGVDTAAPEPAAPGGNGPATEVSGHVTASTAWAGEVRVTGSVTIDWGATVTVMPGTTVAVASGAGITVLGVLDIRGTRPSKVTFHPAPGGANWYGLAIPSGGTMTASYLVQTGGGTAISGTGKVTLVDTQMSHAGGDFLTMSDGTLEMTYSAIGLEPGQSDNTHCDMHVSGAVTITASHSNFSTSSYGLMFYGGVDADFQYTNWFSNSVTDIDRAGASVTGNFSHSYFEAGAPAYAGFTMQDMASRRVADAGVR